MTQQPGPPQPQPPSTPDWQAQTTEDAKGFVSALFDFSFTTFISLKFIRVLYIILMAVIALGALAFLVAALATGEVGAIIAAIIFVPLVALLYLVLVRVYLEVIAVLFRIGENTSKLVDKP